MSLFVSSSKLCLVAVNFGGSCGGFLYCAGAMVELVRGRYGCVYSGLRRGPGLRLCRIEGVRPANRSEDRMAVREMKRATDTSKSLVKREVATVKLWLLLPNLLCHVHSEREVSAVIVSVEDALNMIDGKCDHLSLMLTQSSAIAEIYAKSSIAGAP